MEININLVNKEFTQKDWELITNAMMETIVSRTSDALLSIDVMPKQSLERNVNDSKRLEYLVNVINGTKEYIPLNDIKIHNFYEFIDFEYYALISAKTDKEAIELYKEEVADIANSEEGKYPVRITKEEAETKLISICKEGERTTAIYDFYKHITDNEPYLILIDGNLN